MSETKKQPTHSTAKQLVAALKHLPGWSFTKKGTGLTKKFVFTSHVEALVAIARITVYAEVQQHHPEITFTYKTVKVLLTTKAAGGLTSSDFTLALEIERKLVDK